jgi:hypothetical protein
MSHVSNYRQRGYVAGLLLIVCGCGIGLVAYSDHKKRDAPLWRKYQQVQLGMTEPEVTAILGPPTDKLYFGGTMGDEDAVWDEGQRSILVTFGLGSGTVVGKRFFPQTTWEQARHDCSRAWDRFTRWFD